ncbi:MAG: glycoside hydrolase family 78 protein [Puniceicoccales bacterium]|nr:glycoside hydrolase family 78 protein [Puniceicoccales bacterium]
MKVFCPFSLSRTLVAALFIAIFPSAVMVHAALLPQDISCEGIFEGDAVICADSKPRLGWVFADAGPDKRGQRQSAFQVLIASSGENLDVGKGDVWDSGKIFSDEQSAFPDVKFAPDKKYFWKIRVWDETGAPSAWSHAGVFASAPSALEWKRAQWLGHAVNGLGKRDGDPARNAPWLRKTFVLEKVPAGAALVHVASFGYHELYVNGKRISDTVLEPAVSNLAVRVFSRTYDVSPFLRAGKNTIGVWLGHGWSGYGDWLDIKRAGYHVSRSRHGPAFRLLFSDAGIVSDATWKTRPSSYSKNGPWSYFNFGGETYDAREDIPNWATSDFDDSSWVSAVPLENVGDVSLDPQLVSPNRIVNHFNAVSVEKITERKWRVDMGRVYNGWVRLPLKGKAGSTVILRYTDRDRGDGADSEKESSYGQEDRVILSGAPGGDIFENRFNYRTFRWLTIENVDVPPAAEKITGKLIRSSYGRTSDFISSDPLFTRINGTIAHTYECLTLGGYIVDCSHRERLGYGAEGQASMEAGFFNFNQFAFFRKWLGDWRDVLMKDNRMPNTAPTSWGGGGPAWKIVCATLPWHHYIHYGDKRILAENYAMIKGHLAMLQDRFEKDPKKVLPIFSRDMWYYIGEWYSSLGIDPPEKNRPIPHRLRQFFSNCYTIHGIQTAAKIAGVLGKHDDAAEFTRLANVLKTAVHKEFYDPITVSYAGCKEQSYLSLPLHIGLPPPEERDKVEAALLQNIKETHKGHFTTGVLGSQIQLEYLTKNGYDDLIANAFSKSDYPSYGYFFEKGLTTVPEAWNIIGSGSRCHTSFLSGGAWFVKGFAGIQPDPDMPGFKHFFIRPGATDHARFVKATHKSIRGKISVSWQNESSNTAGKKFELRAVVPPNTTATIRLPLKYGGKITEGGKAITVGAGILKINLLKNKGVADITVGSGHYHFECSGAF